jgi:predicted Zn-ribbon and HTH transcriptional regulator
MGWGEKRRLDNTIRLEHYIINKFNTVKLGIYVDVDEVMKILRCSRATAYNYLTAVAKVLERNGAVLKKIGSKLYLFPSEVDYEEFIKKMSNNIMASTNNTTVIQGIRVKCHKCGYTWITHSKRIYVTCPSCNTKVKVEQNLTNNY